jgi:hypothetical protein
MPNKPRKPRGFAVLSAETLQRDMSRFSKSVATGLDGTMDRSRLRRGRRHGPLLHPRRPVSPGVFLPPGDTEAGAAVHRPETLSCSAS